MMTVCLVFCLLCFFCFLVSFFFCSFARRSSQFRVHTVHMYVESEVPAAGWSAATIAADDTTVHCDVLILSVYSFNKNK